MANTYTKLNIHIVFHVKSTGITIRQKDLGQVFAYIGGIIHPYSGNHAQDYECVRIRPENQG